MILLSSQHEVEIAETFESLSMDKSNSLDSVDKTSSPSSSDTNATSTLSRRSSTRSSMNRERVEAATSSDPLHRDSSMSAQNSEVVSNEYTSERSVSTSVAQYEESLTIRAEDESRIVSAMIDASKKKTTGSFYSVEIELLPSGKIGIGVKDLDNNILAVSMLKRPNGMFLVFDDLCLMMFFTLPFVLLIKIGQHGPAEVAGARLGDIIIAVNYIPCREGSKTLLDVVKKTTAAGNPSITLQCWRCKQLCSETVNDQDSTDVNGPTINSASEIIVQAYFLRKTNVFSDWEMWNFIEILLRHLQIGRKETSFASGTTTHDYSKMTKNEISGAHELANDSAYQRSHHNSMLDLERNILQAKGLRSVLCARIVNTKMQADTVLYVIRVEDIESGYQWGISKRYRDFYALNEELSDISHFTREVVFPKKHLPTFRRSNRFIEERIVVLEQYLRKILHSLTVYATSDPAASKCLRHLQNFLGVDKFIDCLRPPKIDDQRAIEVMTFRFLNDYDSPSCVQCVKFICSVDLESLVEDGPDGYKPVLAHVAAALSEVEKFVLDEHSAQMMSLLQKRRPNLSSDKIRTFVRRCVRRQVEAALYLPLRRKILRIIQPFLTRRTFVIQRAMAILQQAPPDFFLVLPQASIAMSLTRAVKMFRDLSIAYLPADQGQLLMHTAVAVMDLYSECKKLEGANIYPMGYKRESVDNATANTAVRESANDSSGDRDRDDTSEVNHTVVEKPHNDGDDRLITRSISSDNQKERLNGLLSSLTQTSEDNRRSNFTLNDSIEDEQLTTEVETDDKLTPNEFFEDEGKSSVVSADDFLPMFTYVLAQAAIPTLLIVKELMVCLVDDEEAYGECGYYMATLEASTQHLVELADQYAIKQAKSQSRASAVAEGVGFLVNEDDENSDEDSNKDRTSSN